ncbi:hypothetical protein GCM10011409_19900 [Lentibacillus populi]|uniref:Uncharacterized protein n=1 Tax=Lentibacillus populi TaxID=1827502 RepID=A0A9W5TXG4_9BACI|nr:hypothetical protein GCM10011409_19900 [Lentibacillus populi]
MKIADHSSTADIALEGAILDSVKINLHVNNESLPELQDWGMKIKYYIEENLDVKHSLQNDLKIYMGSFFRMNHQ